jgi:hypothetical protein
MDTQATGFIKSESFIATGGAPFLDESMGANGGGATWTGLVWLDQQ